MNCSGGIGRVSQIGPEHSTDVNITRPRTRYYHIKQGECPFILSGCQCTWDSPQTSPPLRAIQPQLPHRAAKSRRSAPPPLFFPHENKKRLTDLPLLIITSSCFVFGVKMLCNQGQRPLLMPALRVIQTEVLVNRRHLCG
ncbi:hypothetical protein VUR80DRAFT_6147 [Thermomyces stellatus]